MRILYIDIDSLRPNHLGCYGYPRPTSPVVDSIAADGVLLTHCYASDNPCNPSRASLFSARFGILNGVVAHDGPGQNMSYAGEGHWHDPDAPMWMRSLQQHGWNTVSFSGFAQRHLSWWFTAGFTEFHGNKLPGALENAEDVNAHAEPWLMDHAQEDNWFLHLNYWDVHHPYRAPDQYWEEMQRHGDGLAFPDDDKIRSDYEQYYGVRTARDWGPAEFNPEYYENFPRMLDSIRNREDFQVFVDGADAGMRYVDDCIGRLLELLEDKGVLKETAIIISSDHGESVGEQGMYWEHGNASEGTAHVPLIIRWPGVTDANKGGSLTGLQYHLDLPPTVADLLGYDIPKGWSGESFANALRGQEWPGRDHLIWGTGIWSFQRAVRTRSHLFIRTLHSGIYNLEPLSLFDMTSDPNQTHNLITEQPEVAATHDHLLSNWWHSYCSGPNSVRDPFQTQNDTTPDIYCSLERYLSYLERHDRTEQANDLRTRRGVQLS